MCLDPDKSILVKEQLSFNRTVEINLYILIPTPASLSTTGLPALRAQPPKAVERREANPLYC